MSCSFWNMRRRLRKQLGIERAIEEEKVVADIATAHEEVKKAVNPKPKNGGAKSDKRTD